MKKILTLLFLCVISFANAQNPSLEILETNENGKILLSIENSSKSCHEVTLQFDQLDNASIDKSNPITFPVLPYQDKFILTISPETGVNYNYSYSSREISRAEADQMVVAATPVAVSPYAEGIHMFTMNGCGRCNYTKNYLNEKKIPFTEYNTSNNGKFNMMMWKELKKVNHVGSVSMPVVLMDGELYYNIADLYFWIDGLVE